jgi:hypothetical protein
VTHLVVTRKKLFDQVGGCAGEFDGAQDLDLFLKLSEVADQTVHIPALLYHWRASATSTSISHTEKLYADEAGRKSIEKALIRAGESAEALTTELKFFYRVRRHLDRELTLSLAIFWQESVEKLIAWLARSLASSGYPATQLIILMARQPDDSAADTIHAETGIRTRCIPASDHQGRGRCYQSALGAAEGQLLAFVDGAVLPESDDWLAALAEYGQSAEFGIVNGRVEYPADYYEMLSTIPDCEQSSPVYYHHFLTNCSVFMNGRHCQQQALAAGSELFLARTELLRSGGGFNTEEFPHLFTVTDICFELHELGLKNIYTPYCRAVTEVNGLTREQQLPPAELEAEKLNFQQKWRTLLQHGDPFYNPGILSDRDCSVEQYRAWLTAHQASP